MTDDGFEAVLTHLRIARRRADTAEVFCPAHEDGRPSLTVSRGREQPVVLNCHAGCSPEAVTAALGMSLADLMGGTEHTVIEYPYRDADGEPLYYVERRVPKSFRPRLLDGSYRRPQAAAEVLYNLPWVLYAKRAGRTVYLVEGERDVETAREFDLIATTAMSGAGQAWLPQFTETLAGADVVVVADNDSAGRTRVRRILLELEPVTRSLRAVIPRYGKDLSDHLWAGFGPELLDPMPVEGAIHAYSLAHVESRSIEWAWEGWVPRSMLTIIEGDPGGGKSVLTCDLAARWSTGAPMPDGTDNPFHRSVKVGIASAEDDPARVILPRLRAAGGNPANVMIVAGVPQGGRYLRNVSLATDVEAIRDLIEAHGLELLILDPLMAYVGNVRTAIDNEVRNVLTPLVAVAEETHCGIVAVRHLRKAGGKAVHAGGGSIAFTGQARSVLLVGPAPRNFAEPQGKDETEVRILAQTKVNIGLRQPSLAYEVVGDNPTAPARVQWIGPTSINANDLVSGLYDADPSEVRAEVAQEVVALLELAGELDFPHLRKQLLLNGVESGEKLVREVLRNVAIKVIRNDGTKAREVVWRLRSDVGSIPPSELPARLGPDDPKLLATPLSDANSSASEADGTDTNSCADQQPPDGSSDVPANSRSDPDLAVACSVCGSTDSLVYWDEVKSWRCRFHNPLTYHAE